MKKVATITFHWAANYGAVLQAYALQKYLEKCGFETEIIDYVPFRVKLLTIISWIRQKKYSEFVKDRLISKFRKAELKLSQKKYNSDNKLKKEKFDYECIICGSDQIWNKNFTMNLNGKPNLSYFLDFAGKEIIKLGYAVSIGANNLPDEYYNLVKPYVKLFRAISVREEKAVLLAQKMGTNASVVCDPTLLLNRNDYDKLLKGRTYKCDRTFTYILHSNQVTVSKVAQEVGRIYGEEFKVSSKLDMYEWLYRIKNSEIVVTNSFHGTVVSLIFNTPFIVVPVEGYDMNDRITTILKAVNLDNRIVDSFDTTRIRVLCDEQINWKEVNKALEEYSYTGKSFLSTYLEM